MRSFLRCCVILVCAWMIQIAPIHAQGLPDLGDTERDAFSPLAERKLGIEIMRDIRNNVDYLDDAPVLEYMNQLGATLLAVQSEFKSESGYDFFFFVVRDPMLNAFALPGGNIGFHSALILNAQSESELASVMAHEIGHVVQRHIARMVGQQKQDIFIPLAGAILGILVAGKGNADISSALIAGSQGLSMQRQLSFSRDAEREADRVGLQTLEEAGFDPVGMAHFLRRLETSMRGYTDNMPAYLRTHPLTSERIADVEARVREKTKSRHLDSLDFYLLKARVLVLQDLRIQGLQAAQDFFEKQLLSQQRLSMVAAKYGLAYVALKMGDPLKAQRLLDEAKVASLSEGNKMIESLQLEILLSSDYPAGMMKDMQTKALLMAESTRQRFPDSAGILIQYITALNVNGRYEVAMMLLRHQAQKEPNEAQWQKLLAKTYAFMGKVTLQHIALAQAYANSGLLSQALEQLTIARKSNDAVFQDLAIIDARQREWQAKLLEEIKEKKEQ
jgi:predicted Zn-dependent protease